MAISINQKPTIYHNLYENTGPGLYHYIMVLLPGILSECMMILCPTELADKIV